MTGMGARLTPVADRKRMVREVLENAYVRVACRYTGRLPADMSDADRAMALDAWAEALEADTEQLMEIMRVAQEAALQQMHYRLHRAEGVDHEMLDEAIEYACDDEGRL